MRDTKAWDVDAIPNIRVASLDVTSDSSVSALVDSIIAEDGKIDILVNNAGIALAASLENAFIDEAKRVFEVNVWGVVRMLQAVLPYMRKAKAGYVINVSSIAGIRGVPGLEYYVGSKFALEGIMESLRYSLAAYNIFLTNVNPGPVKTPLGDKLVSETRGTRPVPDADDDKYMEKITTRVQQNLGKAIIELGQPVEELGQIIVNLAHIKQQAQAFTDVPFNVGTDEYSKGLIEKVRVSPTGWGDLHKATLNSMPQLQPKDQEL